jgi:hypothetical protein
VFGTVYEQRVDRDGLSGPATECPPSEGFFNPADEMGQEAGNEPDENNHEPILEQDNEEDMHEEQQV